MNYDYDDFDDFFSSSDDNSTNIDNTGTGPMFFSDEDLPELPFVIDDDFSADTLSEYLRDVYEMERQEKYEAAHSIILNAVERWPDDPTGEITAYLLMDNIRDYHNIAGKQIVKSFRNLHGIKLKHMNRRHFSLRSYIALTIYCLLSGDNDTARVLAEEMTKRFDYNSGLL